MEGDAESARDEQTNQRETQKQSPCFNVLHVGLVRRVRVAVERAEQVVQGVFVLLLPRRAQQIVRHVQHRDVVGLQLGERDVRPVRDVQRGAGHEIVLSLAGGLHV